MPDDIRQPIPRGTLDLLVLRTLEREPLHGYAVAQRIEALTGGTFRVPGGSLFPALYRLERDGALKSGWTETETGRHAKVYALTKLGRRRLSSEMRNWTASVSAITRLLEST